MSFNWYTRKKSIMEVRDFLPPINKLPTIRRVKSFLAEEFQDGASILDIGASERNLLSVLRKSDKKQFSYRSMDIDRSNQHDYYSLQEINESFDVIACFDVIEHLLTEEVFELLSNVYGLLKKNGVLYLATPNVFHPTAFWRDSTHRSGFRYNELAGLLATAGYRELEIYRVGHIKFLNRIRAIIANPVLRLLQMDYYSRILIRAFKKDGKVYAG